MHGRTAPTPGMNQRAACEPETVAELRHGDASDGDVFRGNAGRGDATRIRSGIGGASLVVLIDRGIDHDGTFIGVETSGAEVLRRRCEFAHVIRSARA